MEGCIAVSPFAGEPSGALLTICTTPAVAAAGDKIAKVIVFEIVPALVSFT